jgi:inward rectifier potassium channel
MGVWHRRRALQSPGGPVVPIGLPSRPFADLYHFLLSAPWRHLILVLVLGYLAANALFALGYLALGDALENARPGSFADAFFFSVQTMATVGYGHLAPRTFGANLLSTVEIITGMVGLACVTGLVFAKFARPTARVLFSAVAVVSPYDGVPSLMFRMANARASQIVEARVSITMVRTERTKEGDLVRRMHDLQLRRSRSASFALTWTAVHPITRESPLFGQDAHDLRDADATFAISFTGYDQGLTAEVHALAGYRADQIRFGSRFRDVLTVLPDGRRAIDYRRFDELDELPVRAARAEISREV